MITAIVEDLAPELVARNSIGHDGAVQLLLTAGDNPERLRSERSIAPLCGVSPVPVSSGNTIRHRLNRGGDRAANSALHIIAIGRLRTASATKIYVAKRIAERHSKLDAIRALKRYIAREVFHIITRRHNRSIRAAWPLNKQKGVQGSQFTSFAFTAMLEDAGIRISMDGRGRWMDNRRREIMGPIHGFLSSSIIERLWRSLKYECVFLSAFETGSEGRPGWYRFLDRLLQSAAPALIL